MATYPSIGLQHRIAPLGGLRVDISDAGGVRGVDLGEETTYRIQISHPLVDATDRDTLLTFYNTNKTATNAITLAGSTYDVLFQQDYTVESVSASYFNLSTVLVGVKQ